MLGRRLRRSRERAGLSLRALAAKVGYPYTYIGRVERGEQLPSEALAESFDVYFGTDGLFVESLSVAQDILIANYSREFVVKERQALRIQVFTSSLIPGLLQTEGYARELFRAGMPGKHSDALEAHVAARMNRQRIFEREDSPFYWAIIDEDRGSIRCCWFSASTWCAQRCCQSLSFSTLYVFTWKGTQMKASRMPDTSKLTTWRRSSCSGSENGAYVEVLDGLADVTPVRDRRFLKAQRSSFAIVLGRHSFAPCRTVASQLS
ncbi:helix-turn-helix domain-containing protein [Streptomyces rectiverticillatus]|uniref:helix-turn-helix domain-containing protein n=1 Tax=Streptomyces rectiverticillatus TaxID=173860 RepID=UPI001FE98145|nr:Scr1 family TA system antitoxin-like transcriptional regulator [Streptomyces rectiverticillatus]